MTLAGTNTFGELDVRALLAVYGVPRLDHVGSGWGGGRTALYRGAAGEAAAVALDWDTERDAEEWAEAVVVYVNEAFDAATPGLPAPVACEASLCWQIGGRGIGFVHEGPRTALVVAGSAEAAGAVARTIVPAA
jgi:hypothetical protein